MDKPANPADAALEALIDRLHERGRLRVWSLVVTVFGDAVVPRGGKVALTVLQEIMGRLRVEPGALRTALSRLAGDGWVVREKDGRNSFYRLADQGRHAFDLATRRIYAAGPPEWGGTWTIAVAPAANGNGASLARQQAMGEAGFIHAGGRTFLRPETSIAPETGNALEGLLVVSGRARVIPADPGAFWRLEELGRAYVAFAEAMRPLADTLDAGAALSSLEAMAARTLLIHDWRRLVLHDPSLPRALLPEDWPGEKARAVARRIYARLAAPSEAWLSNAGLPPLQDRAGFAARFGINP